MSRKSVWLALLAGALTPLMQGAGEQSEFIGDDIYVNCEYRVAIHFPEEPMFRDIEYREGEHVAPARQFYVEEDMYLLSVTIAYFADGPDKDWAKVDGAAMALQERGEVIFDARVWYDEPNLDGRQLRVTLPDGRLLRSSVYMVDHRLYVVEAIADPNDFEAMLFSESVSLINENGVDFDGNPLALASQAPGTSAGLPPRRYDCSRLNQG